MNGNQNIENKTTNLINEITYEDCKKRLPYYYPTKDKEFNSTVERIFAESICEKLRNLDVEDSDNKDIMYDSIFGDKSFECNIPINILDLEGDVELLEYNNTDSIVTIDDKSDEEKNDVNLSENPILKGVLPTSLENTCTIDESKISEDKDITMSKWLDKNDSKWLESIIQSTDESTKSEYNNPYSTIKKYFGFKKNCEKENECGVQIELISKENNEESRLSENTKYNMSKKSNFWGSFKPKFLNFFKKSNKVTKEKKKKLVKANSEIVSDRKNNDLWLIYYLEKDNLPFRTRLTNIPKSKINLKYIKSILPKVKGKKMRIFFKNIVTNENGQNILFDEIIDDDEICPFIGKEIICKLFYR